MMLLARAFFETWNVITASMEGGGFSKRPFGNSDVERDILEIIDLEIDEDNDVEFEDACAYAAGLYDDLGAFLSSMWRKACPESQTSD